VAFELSGDKGVPMNERDRQPRQAMDLNDPDFPDWVREAADNAEHDEVVRALNSALKILAVCQRHLKIRHVSSIRTARGDVAISIHGDAAGKSHAHYTEADWSEKELRIKSTLADQKDAEST
jgi:hypothetical protein